MIRTRLLRSPLVLGWMLVAVLALLPFAGRAATSSFDHFTTGFDLVGMHRSVACESCHVGGIFKGTPTDCFSCHAAGSRIGASSKPTNHILSSNDCAQCHTPFGWKPVAKFNHINVLGTCSSCHNNVQAVGKGKNHIPTTAECSTCHLVSLPWSAAHYDHAGIHDGCARCHDNVHAPGKPLTHLPTTEACEVCHSPSNFVTFAGTQMNHVGITNDCQACHETGMQWYGVQMVDRPTTAQDAYHPSASSPGGADCANCHVGFNKGDFAKLVRPANHIPIAPVPCVTCHVLTDMSIMAPLLTIHQNAPSSTTNCQQCHGSNASYFDLPAINFHIVGIPSNHMPTQQSCEVCHAGPGSSFAAVPVGAGAKFANSLMNHAGTSTCAECHGPTVTAGSFVGVNNIIVMPPTSPAGDPSAHIPSSTACETCHKAAAPAGYIAANATRVAPGTLFQTPAPTTTQIHAGVTTNCSSCHEGGYAWMSMNQYPIAPTTYISGKQYTGFQTRPNAAGGTFIVADSSHPSSGDCGQCHTNTNYFDSNLKPANHIPYSSSATCDNCHKGASFAVMPALIDIHTYAQSQTTNCAQCHGSSAASFAIPAANFAITGLPANHIPTSQSCEVCHVGPNSSVTATPVGNGARFANSQMNHAGVTTCDGCHGPKVTNSTFVGISKIVVMPSVTPAGASSAHIPSSTSCEVCHQGSTPSGFIAANATMSAPGSLFQNPVPTNAMIHTGVTGNCQTCHESTYAWMGMSFYPIAPTTFTAGQHYTGFQNRPSKSAGTYMVLDAAHPAKGDCVQCHGTNFDYFDSIVKPSNHIPYAASATCANCHKGTDFSVLPALADIHAYAPSTTSNCAQCHGSNAGYYALPDANFAILGLPSNHIPTSQSCEVCHVGAGSSIAATPVGNGAKFTNSQMNHAGITTCVSCHGPSVGPFAGISQIILMPPSTPAGASSAHIPSGTACETCHLASMPAGFIGANAKAAAPGSLFLNPAPTTTQIHAGVTANCQSCHEGGYTWMSMGQYPISPTSFQTNAQYTGFNTRPNATGSTYQIKDAAHPTTGDCVTCHGAAFNYFQSAVKPANHIPYATSATCSSCHKGSDFSVLPSLTDIHANAQSTTTNCAQCHGANASTFAIPAANFAIVGIPSNHMPTTQSCEVCHVGAGSSMASTPVVNGAKFTNSQMSHKGITTCVSCHGPTVTGFAGVTKIIVMPAVTPAGVPSSHIPSSTACETCHLATMPSGNVAANAASSAPGSLFMTPAPTTTQIHAGITGNCQSCHESGYAWMDMNLYPIAPTTLSTNAATQYTGFNTRPNATGGTFQIKDAAHPTTGDCVSCHGASFSYFSGQAEPANHIPTLPGAACSTCHTTAGNYAVYTTNLTQLHTAVSTACSTCHADGKGPFAGAAGFAIIQMSTRGMHIPITNVGVPVECSGCHKSVTAFSGTIMSHGAIGDTSTAATGNACDACHEYGFRSMFYGVSIGWTRDSSKHYICGSPGTPSAPNTTICSGGGSDCLTGCHQHANQSSFTKYKRQPRPTAAAPKPTVTTKPTSPATAALPLPLHRDAPGLMPNGRFDHADAGTAPCASCHNGARAIGKGPQHPATTNACADCHSTVAWMPVMRIDHADVLGTCVSCHDGRAAKGKPPGHIVSGNNCDTCHTTSSWKGAAFDHSSVLPGTCLTCHNGIAAIGKPARHPVTVLSCDTCHYTLGWTPVRPQATQRVTPAGTVAPPRLPRAPVPQLRPTPRTVQ